MISACHAGYALPGLRDALAASGLIPAEALQALWRSACAAECDSTLDFSGRKLREDHAFFTAANLIARGLPTFPSISLEKLFTENFHRCVLEEDGRGRLRSRWIAADERFLDLLLRALHAAVPPGGGKKTGHAHADSGALLSSAEGREALQFALSPIAAARVQLILVRMLIAGGLDLAASEWSIVIIERDVPCGALAIAEFRRLMDLLFTLEGKGRTLPAITATVRPHTAFVDSPLHAQPGVRLAGKGALIPAAAVLIDVGTLDRKMTALQELPAEIKHRVTLRPGGSGTEPRRFQIAEPQPWRPLEVKGAAGLDPLPLAAVSSLLADCFRIGRPSDEQLRLIDLVLQNRSCLAALRPMSGKSLVYQFAALLQPALSFVIEPLASLAADQRDQLADVSIDCVECLHEGLDAEERGDLFARVRGRGTLLLLVTAEMFRSGETDELLEQLRQDKVHFSQCVVDEAQCMSEWSHDLRPSMHRAPAFAVPRMQTGKKNAVAVRLLTATLSRDVLADLRWQLAESGRGSILDDARCVVGREVLQPQQQFHILRAPASGTPTGGALAVRQAMAAEALRETAARFTALNAQAAPAMRVPDDDGVHLPTVLYCPYSSGTLGATNQYAAGVTEPAVDDTLRNAGMRFAVFIGKDDSRSRVGRHGLVDAIVQRGLFRRGERDLIVATRAYGIGTHKSDIRCTLHLASPPGVERLVQECARGGHDGRFTLHTILSGESAPGRESEDLRLGVEMLEARSGDAAREKQIVHDLLREISYPEDSNTGRIAGMIAEEFGIETRVGYWQRGLYERMYVQHGSIVFGYLDLLTQEVVPDPKYPEAETARDILSFAAAVSLKAAGSGPSLSSWVAATFPADIDDGIARQLADFEPGADFTLHVGFENDREPLLTRMHQLLWRQAEIEIQRKILSEIPENTWREFRDQLIRRVGRPELFATLDPQLEERLVQLFNMIRARGDTERVLLRLATLGVLRDYKTQPLARKFSLHMTARSDEEIRGALEEYLGLFLTARQVERSLSSLHSYPGETVLERCLYFLIDFAYGHCHERQLAGARTMDALCQSALVWEDAGFRERIEAALTAKYALPDRLPAAIPRTTDRLGLLAEYMHLIEADRSASTRENASQLAASCALLETSYPTEPVLPMLHAFAELVNARDETTWKTARAAFVHAFGRSAAASGREGADYLAAVDGFEARFRRYFGEDSTTDLLSALTAEAERVRAKILPPAIPAASLSAPEKSTALEADKKNVDADRTPSPSVGPPSPSVGPPSPSVGPPSPSVGPPSPSVGTPSPSVGTPSPSVGTPAGSARRKNAREHRDELDRMLADIETEMSAPTAATEEETIPAPRASAAAAETIPSPPPAAAAAERVPAPPPAATTAAERIPAPPSSVPAAAAVDESLRAHLEWLQTFNNRFLKHYES